MPSKYVGHMPHVTLEWCFNFHDPPLYYYSETQWITVLLTTNVLYTRSVSQCRSDRIFVNSWPWLFIYSSIARALWLVTNILCRFVPWSRVLVVISSDISIVPYRCWLFVLIMLTSWRIDGRLFSSRDSFVWHYISCHHLSTVTGPAVPWPTRLPQFPGPVDSGWPKNEWFLTTVSLCQAFNWSI